MRVTGELTAFILGGLGSVSGAAVPGAPNVLFLTVDGLRPSPERFVGCLARADLEAPWAVTLPAWLERASYHTVSPGEVIYEADGSLDAWSETPWRSGLPDYRGALAAADIDGDGRMEIAVGAADEKVYLLDAEGRERWQFACKASYMSDPPVPDDVRIADLDNDGSGEIVVAANWVHVLRPDGGLRWEDCWRYQRGRYVGDVQSIDLRDIDHDGRIDIVCGIRLNYPVTLAYDPDGKRIYPRVPLKQPNHQPLRVDPPNDTLMLDLFADGGPPQIVVAASSQLNVRWVGAELDTKRAADLSGVRIALAAAETSPADRPLLVTATDMGAVLACRAYGARGDAPTIDLRTEWVRLVGDKITALEAVATNDGGQFWAGTQSGRAHVFLAASGNPLGSTLGAGSPVVQIVPGREEAKLVHADGRIASVACPGLPPSR
jgi:hypothetical protein